MDWDSNPDTNCFAVQRQSGEIGWCREKRKCTVVLLIGRSYGTVGLELNDFLNRAQQMGQVCLIFMADDDRHACIHMYVMLTVFRHQVVVTCFK